jgi:GNAT superfamily N-acetyltransferase
MIQQPSDTSGPVSPGGLWHDPSVPEMTTTIGKVDSALDERLSDELDKVNAAATSGTAAAEELTVRIEKGDELLAGVSGWTWGRAAGIAMTWVREDQRGTGLGARLLTAFENEARERGCTHLFVTSFTFQAPDFYRRQGYQEIFRWDAVPLPGHDDVHFRKDLRSRRTWTARARTDGD